MTDIAKIAAGLTKAQKEALLARDAHSIDRLLFEKPRIATQLHRMGLLYVMTSPMGDAVRAHIQENDNGA